MVKVDLSQIEDVGNKHQITAKKGTAGRPEKEVKRDRRVVVYFTDEEYKKLEALAHSKDKTISQFSREDLLRARAGYQV